MAKCITARTSMPAAAPLIAGLPRTRPEARQRSGRRLRRGRADLLQARPSGLILEGYRPFFNEVDGNPHHRSPPRKKLGRYRQDCYRREVHLVQNRGERPAPEKILPRSLSSCSPNRWSEPKWEFISGRFEDLPGRPQSEHSGAPFPYLWSYNLVR